MNNATVLDKMITIYKPNGVDWMGYRLTKGNPYTYHHIKEKRNGGKVTLSNGAILTKEAHNELNMLDRFCPEAYEEYQAIFRYINSFNGPIPEDKYDLLMQEIAELALDIHERNGFTFSKKPVPFRRKREKKTFTL